MTEPHLHRVAVVLYQPQDLVNVAAVVRAMSNFGLGDLRLVEPAAFDPYRIEGIAHHTEAIVSRARRFVSLAEAVADCGLLLGTAGRPARADRVSFTPRAAAPVLLEAAADPLGRPAAIIFGREQDGLPNEVLAQCHGVLTIPTHEQNRSLNLAQAAVITFYELWQAAGDWPGAPAGGGIAVAPPARLHTLFASLEALLTLLYPRTSRARLTNSLSRLRAMLMRSAPRDPEAAALTNLFRHAARALRKQP